MNPYIGVPYMGTKRQLAAMVSRLAEDCHTGIVLDAFAGMCSVGSAIAPRRQIWTNDLQVFATTVAEAFFCSNVPRPDSLNLIELSLPFYQEQKKKLRNINKSILKKETEAIYQEDTISLIDIFDSSIKEANENKKNTKGRFDLFTERYAGSYFSYSQAIDIDSIRFAVDRLVEEKTINKENHRWALIALCTALSKCAATTGHFAQPLAPKSQNKGRIIKQKKRDIAAEWAKALHLQYAHGSATWRKKNRSYNCDATKLLQDLSRQKTRPKLVYIDPPYTRDQYSRYYHIYETMILYDYPVAEGKGLYRDVREVSNFSHAGKVESSIDELVRACADLRADLIFSYPTNGLFQDSRSRIPDLLQRAFRRKADVVEIPYAHSTMGASKGTKLQEVTEVLYRVRN